MEELQVPTKTLQVEIFSHEGVSTRGELYLGHIPYHDPSAVDVVELLNDERSFLAFRCPDGHDTLLNKAHVTRVRIEGATEIDLLGDLPVDEEGPSCTLQMSDGTLLEGKAVIDTPAAFSRLFDKLNRASRFTPFVSADGIDLVNIAHVVRVD